MRKSNSIFKTAFVSEAGAELANNDYFAYVEDDDYACYVLASGITDFETSEAAKEVVEHLILSFEERPSMSKTTLLNYMKETNARLLSSNSPHRLKASVIMLVTDYEKFRYVTAGNVRLRMFRSGRFYLKSSDMSLANDLIKRGKTDTPLDKHEERHNLYAYLGKKGVFKPYVSSLQKLADADILGLYSQGIWEHVDEQEIDEIFSEATDNPQDSVDYIEDILLSRQPEELESYTIAAIFVNKVYNDPERERKRIRYIKIAIGILIVLLIIGIIYYIWSVWHEGKVQDYNDTVKQAQELKESENYSLAREKYQAAVDMANKLRYKDEAHMLMKDLKLLDSVIAANNFLNNGHYEDAYDGYSKALKYADGNDRSVKEYAQRRLNNIEGYLEINQLLSLGAHLVQNEDYDAAESLYLKAIDKSFVIHDNDGRERATAALEKVYDKRAAIRKAAEDKIDAQKQVAMSDALNKGDDLLAAGDIEGARQAYLNARNLSDNPADRAQTSNALMKVTEATEKKNLEEKTSEDERKKLFSDAIKTEAKGDESFAAGDYAAAQVYYLTAMEQYINLAEEPKLKPLQAKLDATKLKAGELYAQKDSAEVCEANALSYYADKNYEEARMYALQAKEAYKALGLQTKIDAMEVLLQQIAVDEMVANAVK